MVRKLPEAVQQAMAKAGVKQKAPKYRAIPTVVDGIRFDSKAEAEYYRKLKVDKCCGKVLYFIRQIAFDLPGGYRHRVDFMTVSSYYRAGSYPNGRIDQVEYYEVKGKDIGTGKMKRKQVEEIYGIKIHVLRAVYRGKAIIRFEEVE